MNRRGFLGMSLAAAGMVFVPKFGRWHQQGSGLFVPTSTVVKLYEHGHVWVCETLPPNTDWSKQIVGARELHWSVEYRTPAGRVTQLSDYPVYVSTGDTLTIQMPTELM